MLDKADIQIQGYDHNTKSLINKQAYKVKKFLDHGCIEQIGESGNKFVCKPIPGYNKTTYELTRLFSFSPFKCTCQGFNKRGFCSHVAALHKYLNLKKTKGQFTLNFTSK